MAKKKPLTINQRMNNEIDRWMELKKSYPKDGYDTIEDHLQEDEEFLEEFMQFVALVRSAKKRNYINSDKAIELIIGISYFPIGTILDAIPDEGIADDC